MLFDPSSADILHLVSDLYDAVIEPQRWQAVCESIRQRFRLSNLTLAVHNTQTSYVAINMLVGVPVEYQQVLARPDYTADVVRLWGGAAMFVTAPMEEPLLMSNFSDPSTWSDTVCMRDFGTPLGLTDQLGILLVRNNHISGNLGAGIHASRGPISEYDLQSLRFLAPHLRRATTISGLLGDAMAGTATFRAALDATAYGVVLTDDNLGIVHANAAATSMLAAGDPLRDIGGRLALREELVPGQLAAAIRAVGDEGSMGRQGLGIPARRRDGSPVTLTVMPLDQRRGPGLTAPRAVAAILISNGEPPKLPGDAMALLYDLTPSETRIFELSMTGASNQSMADALGLSLATIKSHMLRVLEKTGQHNRAGLVNLAHQIKMPL